MIKEKEPRNEWRLKEIKIQFTKGYEFNKTKDRYEGRIEFENGENESFKFKIREDLAQPYIDLMAKDIVRCAESLGARLVESLGLKEKLNDEKEQD